MTEGLKQICEIVADLRRQGITLTVEGDRLRATPPAKLTADIVALVKPLRYQIMDFLRDEDSHLGFWKVEPEEVSEEVSQEPARTGAAVVIPATAALLAAATQNGHQYLIEDETCVRVPDYCRTCGNLDFYAVSAGWQCAFCFPRMVHDRIYKAPSLSPLIGEARPCVPFAVVRSKQVPTSFFSWGEIAATWPPDWSPPRPLGDAATRVTAMPAGERARHATEWRRELALRELREGRPKFYDLPSVHAGRDAIIARQSADRAADALVDDSFEVAGAEATFFGDADFEADYTDYTDCPDTVEDSYVD